MARFRLSDGTPVILRALRPADREVFLAAFSNLSDRSRYLRFHKLDPRLRERDIAYLTEVDQNNHVALAVFGPQGGIALGRFVRLVDEPDHADLALTVLDAWQRRGVATLLLAALMHRARAIGLTSFQASVLDENRPARAMISALVPPDHREGAAWLYRLPTDPDLLPDNRLVARLRAWHSDITRRLRPNG